MSAPMSMGLSKARPMPSVRLSERAQRQLVGAGTVVALLLLWEGVVASGLVDPLYISSPSRILRVAIDQFGSGAIWPDIRVSSIEFLVGYVAAILVGIPLGLMIGWSRRLNYLLGPFIDILNAVPRVTFLPLLILWFGIGMNSKFAVVFMGAVIPIVIATHAGVRANEARFIRVARSFSASEWKIMTAIILPGTVPFLFAGLKYGAGRALLGVVVGEIYASTAGVGHMIVEAGNLFDTDTVFFGVLLFMAAGVAVTTILNRIERHFDAWRPRGLAQ
ncbi:ABC transporter permease [Ancylobacter polymorphus]|uniref:NitT/TauT family transport system permease protein n=1 Tax=Ancylobacter polymorphus TaxID=223390 RepID=A0ABU0BGJ3_9HYPH|nr:ABC transporter permease [Ancylobacter polymorphus]MDQ0304952.1 NitT/TauT family transport system permease protein [Ancylobacter polymorphus]